MFELVFEILRSLNSCLFTHENVDDRFGGGKSLEAFEQNTLMTQVISEYLCVNLREVMSRDSKEFAEPWKSIISAVW